MCLSLYLLLNIYPLLIIIKKNKLNIRLSKTESLFVKRVEIVIPQMKKSEIVNHFQKEGYPQRTIYNTINRLHSGESIKDKKQTGRPTSWTTTRKNKLKRLTNNRKGVSQRLLGRKFNVSHMTFCRQLSKMNIFCFKREIHRETGRESKEFVQKTC